jgi:hypothetical protein
MRARGMIGVGAVLMIVTLNSGHAADVQTYVGDVDDRRTTGKFFAKLEVELKFLGDDIEGAKGLRCTVTKAVDDTGRNLVSEKNKTNEFSDFDSDNPNQTKVIVKLKNPSRKAATVKEISGEIEIFKPDNDPASIVTVTNIAGKPKILLSHPSLTAAQIQITVLSREQYDKAAEESGARPQFRYLDETGGGKNNVILYVKDPQFKLVKIEFLDASGKVILSGGMRNRDLRTYDFSKPLPKGAKIRVYVATSKSLIKAPFMLRDLALP